MSFTIVMKSEAGNSLYYAGVSVATRRVDWSTDKTKAHKLMKLESARHVCDKYGLPYASICEETGDAH